MIVLVTISIPNPVFWFVTGVLCTLAVLFGIAFIARDKRNN